MIDRYCVLGHPIGHSKSPTIHAAFAADTDQAMEYVAIEAPLDGFADTWRSLVAEGVRGANVTLPFKQQAWQLCDRLSQRARRAGAVNTLVVEDDGCIWGDTTDGVGLVADLHRHGVSIKDARILVLGAGGAVRGVLEPLLAEQPKQLRVVNRTASKAIGLADDFADLGAIEGAGLEAIECGYDLVINGTSASLSGDLPPLPDDLLAENGAAYDMMYAAQPTVFVAWAAARGARGIDGLGMLVEQAAASFAQWRGVKPATEAVLSELRRQL